ncbi:hypothetical protein I4F81_006289 [Pyropia yezoensis]|uniref:Uncharacterized protein n=1 Tax=Pyropia yezoensis TaxID=2788 RepID=A0ACC3C160_PYRYE|nr:hypothetical protein I4F81_006289 [Neopyropia yezoensis]
MGCGSFSAATPTAGAVTLCCKAPPLAVIRTRPSWRGGSVYCMYSFSTASAMANSTIRAATVEQCPVMAMADLGVSYYHVLLQAGTHHVPHLHPRAAEVLLVTAGTVDVFFLEEGGDGTGPAPRLIRNNVDAAGVALFPRGLLHGVTCVSASPCT